jgi:hypothetical protein
MEFVMNTIVLLIVPGILGLFGVCVLFLVVVVLLLLLVLHLLNDMVENLALVTQQKQQLAEQDLVLLIVNSETGQYGVLVLLLVVVDFLHEQDLPFPQNMAENLVLEI